MTVWSGRGFRGPTMLCFLVRVSVTLVYSAHEAHQALHLRQGVFLYTCYTSVRSDESRILSSDCEIVTRAGKVHEGTAWFSTSSWFHVHRIRQ